MGANPPPGDPPLRNPITGITGCCAREARGQATAMLPKAVMKSRRLTQLNRMCRSGSRNATASYPKGHIAVRGSVAKIAGSAGTLKTIGIVEVAALAESVDGTLPIEATKAS